MNEKQRQAHRRAITNEIYTAIAFEPEFWKMIGLLERLGYGKLKKPKQIHIIGVPSLTEKEYEQFESAIYRFIDDLIEIVGPK